MRIMLVDDDPMASMLVAAILEDAGHELTVCATAAEAIDGLHRHDHVELVLSDLNMPDMDGLALLRVLRENGHVLPFVLLSGDDAADVSVAEWAPDAVVLKDGALEHRLPGVLASVLAEHHHKDRS